MPGCAGQVPLQNTGACRCSQSLCAYPLPESLPPSACSAIVSTAARENRSTNTPGQPAAAATPGSWQGAPGLAFQPLQPNLQLHAQGVGTRGSYSGDVSSSAWHADAEAAAVFAAASGRSWQPASHGMLVPSAGSEHSQLLQQMLPQHMLPAELPAHHSGVGQAGPPATDAPDRQAADQALQQATPGPAVQAGPQQPNEAVPDAGPQSAMHTQQEAEAGVVQEWQAGQGPAAGMPPLAGDLARAGAAPVGVEAVGVEVPHSTWAAAWPSGMPLADSHLLGPPPLAAAVHSQAQWLGGPAAGCGHQALPMPPNGATPGVVSASTQQMPTASSADLVHDSAAMPAAAQPASWRSTAWHAHSQELRGSSRQDTGVPWSVQQQLALLPSVPAPPTPHRANTDGDTLQQLIARAERLRLMLDRAAGEQAAMDWQR